MGSDKNAHGFDRTKYDKAAADLYARVGPRLPKDARFSKAWTERFLRARSLDVEKAEKMLLASLEWRKAHDVDSVLAVGPDPRVVRYLPHGITGQTKDGHQVYVERSGICGLPGPDLIPMSVLFQWKCWISERLEELGRGPGASGLMICVLDMTGLTMAKMTQHILDVVKMIGDVDEKNYPESLHRIYILNTSVVFTAVWGMVKYFFAAEVRDKIVMMGSDYSDMYKELDPALVPVFLKGGKHTASSKEEWAGDLAYMARLPRSPAQCGLESKEVVRAGKRFTKEVHAPAPGTALAWAFTTEKKSIEFSVVAPSGKVVHAPKKFEPSGEATKGSHVAQEAGGYTFHFCNKFSWSAEKVLFYNLEARSSQPSST